MSILACMSQTALADQLLLEHFNEATSNNSPINQAPGWSAWALTGGVLTDYSALGGDSNGTHPTIGTGTGVTADGGGYSVFGQGNVVSNVLAWVDTTTTLHNCILTNISIYTKNNAAASTEQIVVRIGGQWYASTAWSSGKTCWNSGRLVGKL